MTTLVHISDLHFGRLQPGTVEPLLASIRQLEPRVIAVSGDLTQRARSVEFHQAKEFLKRLPAPYLVVPGNHDVPLHNLLSRFLRPLAKYERHITRDLLPFYHEDGLAILGINTARSLTAKGGRINSEQMGEIRRRLCPLPAEVIKMVVTHHPFDLPEGADDDDLVGRAEQAMGPLSACGVDLLLAGHLHVGLAGCTARRYRIDGFSAIFVQAGTAISSRGRGEPNSFNVIRIDTSRVTIERMSWDEAKKDFAVSSREIFSCGADGWMRLTPRPS